MLTKVITVPFFIGDAQKPGGRTNNKQNQENNILKETGKNWTRENELWFREIERGSGILANYMMKKYGAIDSRTVVLTLRGVGNRTKKCEGRGQRVYFTEKTTTEGHGTT